jgi:hypothetical protein
MLEQTKNLREDWTERVGTPKRPLTPSIFPDDAAAIIYRPARSAMTSGKANTRHWKLRFDRRTPPFIEPLMGWTGGDDPLAPVELTFPTRDAAVAYAKRQGLTFIVQGPDREGHAPRHRNTDEGSEEQTRPTQQARTFAPRRGQIRAPQPKRGGRLFVLVRATSGKDRRAA